MEVLDGNGDVPLTERSLLEETKAVRTALEGLLQRRTEAAQAIKELLRLCTINIVAAVDLLREQNKGVAFKQLM